MGPNDEKTLTYIIHYDTNLHVADAVRWCYNYDTWGARTLHVYPFEALLSPKMVEINCDDPRNTRIRIYGQS